MSTPRPSITTLAALSSGGWLAVALAVTTAVVGAGCTSGKGTDSPPASALAQTREAQDAFRGIERKWRAGGAQRGAAEASLREFIRQHPGDGRSQLATSYLAWLHLDRGDAPAARALAAEARKGPQGVARDLADIVEAGVARRMGDPRMALALLRPLTDRVIDPQHRLLHARELTEAAVAAKRWELVPRALRGQLDAARATGADSRSDVRLTLDSLPRPALREAFEQLSEFDATHEEHGWLFDSVWRRLASLALAKRDSTLARALLEEHPQASPNTFELEALRRLAARHDIAPRAMGRRLGLLLEPGDSAVRARSAEAAAGAVAALQLSRNASQDVRLVSRVRQEGESVAEALQVLRSEGAALLVAGLSNETAAEAMRFAETHGVGVLLLTRPEVLPPDLVYTYVLGPSAERLPEGQAFVASGQGLRLRLGPQAPAGIGFYEALGHDAVVLGAGALAKFDAPTTAQPSLVKRFQRRVAKRLGSVEAELWSSPSRGFDGGRVLHREASDASARDAK